MSKKPEVDEKNPILTRRQFGVASVTAGLGLLLGTNNLFAQEQQQQKATAPADFEYEPRRIVDSGPMLEPLPEAILPLAMKVDVSDKRLRMDIYAINESDEDLILDHTSNGVARHVAAVKLSIGDKTYELQGRPEGWERAHLSRSIRPGFRTIAAAKKGQPTKFHLGEFDAEWSKELVEHAKKLSGKEAKLEVGMTLRVVNAQKTTVKPPEATTIKLPKKMVLPG
jgi:hypothetical protein